MDYAGKVSGVILEKKMSRPCVYFLNLNVFIAQQGRELIFFSLTQNPGQRAPSVLYGSMFLLPHSCRLPLPFPSRGLGFPQLSRLSASVPFPSPPLSCCLLWDLPGPALGCALGSLANILLWGLCVIKCMGPLRHISLAMKIYDDGCRRDTDGFIYSLTSASERSSVSPGTIASWSGLEAVRCLYCQRHYSG